jgi:cell division protein FtsI (penicillin-binding protein 3)
VSLATKSTVKVSVMALPFMGGLFVLAGFSQLKLQTWERQGTIDLADSQHRYVHSATLWAQRGSIFDRNGQTLAKDANDFVLSVDFDEIPHSPGFYMDLSQATGVPVSEFQSLAEGHEGPKSVASSSEEGKIAGKSTPHFVQSWLQPLNEQQRASVAKAKSTWHTKGVSVIRTSRREYPLEEAAACLVGVVRDREPANGLEVSQDELLQGTNGKLEGPTDKRGRLMPLRLSGQNTLKKDGKDLTLTIDSEIQVAATEALKISVEENKADNGVAMVMDPKTGDLLAMANWPSFKPYLKDGSDSVSQGYNPSYMAQLEPGSMFKVLTLAKALDERVVSMHEQIQCRGEYHPTKKTRIRCDSHHGNRAHGWVDAEGAIARSCNVSAATWALRVGRDPFLDYIKKLGLLGYQKIGVPNEAPGDFNFKEPSQILQLATVGFGQSITCSPVGLMGAFGMLANNGLMVKPRLIRKIGDQDCPIAPAVPIIRPEVTQEVLTCMEDVIQSDSGTGKSLRIPGYRLGGKTGTAQKIGKVKGYVSNFVGFVPANAPKAVILVMVNNPKGQKYYGADVAGPVFKALAESVIKRLQIPRTEEIVQSKVLRTHSAMVSNTEDKKTQP